MADWGEQVILWEEQVILASTDTSQHAEEVVRYYRLRYQLELRIRDAKGSSLARSCLLVQHAGLTHCQARSPEKLDFHLNMSVAAVNVLRLLAQKAECSPRTYRREAYNRLLIRHLFSKLGLSVEYDQTDPRVQAVIHTGGYPHWTHGRLSRISNFSTCTDYWLVISYCK